MSRGMCGGLGLVSLGVGGLALAFMPTSALANTAHTVGSGGGADFTTISAAIAAASDGDAIVVVDQDTYDECLTVDKELTLVGSRLSGGSVTVSCSTAGDAALLVDGTLATIAGIDFTHTDGRGVVVEGTAAELILADSEIASVTADDGGGLHVSDGVVQLHRVRFDKASATSRGGAIYQSGGSLVGYHVTITGGSAANGGGIAVVGGSFQARDLTIERSTASASGGAIYGTSSSPMIIINGSLSANEASGDGGAMYLDGTVTHRLRGLEISSNTAANGAGIFSKAPMAISDVLLLENDATDNGGGLLLGAAATLVDVEFRDNKTGEAGGGVYTESALSTRECRFDSNSAKEGGGVYTSGRWDDSDSVFDSNVADEGGGGAFVDRSASQLYGTVFVDNSSTSADGGGMWLDADTVSGGRVVLYGVVFDDNDADSGRGGGLYMEPNGRLLALGLEVVLNSAATGGGIYFGVSPRDIYVQGARIHANIADNGGGVASAGSSLDTSVTTVPVIQRSRIYDNEASVHGGGAFVDRAGLYVTDSWIYSNTADKDGGGLYTINANWVRMRGSSICDNSAGGRGGGVAMYTPWGYRELYLTSMIGNRSVSDGGAAYVQGFNTTSGNRRDLSFYYNTVIGNDSSGTVFDGVHNNNAVSNPTQLVSRFSQFGFQSYSSHSQATSGNTSSILLDSVYLGGTAPILNNATYTIGRSGNVSANPGWQSYSRSDCFDDDLRSSSYTSYGAQSSTTDFGSRIYADGDGDGVSVYGGDCNDSDRNIYPGNTEIVGNFVDEDCVGFDDRDGDDDGYAASAVGGTDCDDADSSIYPGAPDTPYDGVDADCSGGDDDADGDGFDDGVDCDDTDARIHPGAIESAFDGVDQDCDGLDLDLDGDGFSGTFTASDGSALSSPPPEDADCEPADGSINPGAEEIWYDGLDQDCLGDDDYDRDGDGDRSALEDPDGLGGDCDDFDPLISSLAAETWYDGVDQNCDALSDYDQDFDGDDSDEYGGGDCDDTEPSIYDGAPDILDEDSTGAPIDNDCDRKPNPDDDGDGVLNWYEGEQGTDPLSGDSDGDSIPDGIEWPGVDTHEQQLAPIDSDGDGTIDALDTDSDDDGLSDRDETGGSPRSPRDTDGDGLPDYRDGDDDGDGLDTSVEIADGVVDSDGDGTPNHLDPDSDNDGVADGAERDGDSDGDGIPDRLDAGSDWGEETTPVEAPAYGFGLGCSSTGTAPLGLTFLLLPLLVLRRRR